MVTPGNVLADVGTDHGYVPIVLVKEEKIPRAIAMDLRSGPLARAKEHIVQFGLTEYIQTRLSDGVEALAVGEAQTILIAGMGGELVIHILRDGENVCRSAEELILQPQSELCKVRRFLRENHYRLVAEDMVLEDGKYYPMMKAVPEKAGREIGINVKETGARMPETDGVPLFQETGRMQEICDRYGGLLLRDKHPVLCQFLKRQQVQLEAILKELKARPDSAAIQSRIAEVEKDLSDNGLAQKLLSVDRLM